MRAQSSPPRHLDLASLYALLVNGVTGKVPGDMSAYEEAGDSAKRYAELGISVRSSIEAHQLNRKRVRLDGWRALRICLSQVLEGSL